MLDNNKEEDIIIKNNNFKKLLSTLKEELKTNQCIPRPPVIYQIPNEQPVIELKIKNLLPAVPFFYPKKYPLPIKKIFYLSNKNWNILSQSICSIITNKLRIWGGITEYNLGTLLTKMDNKAVMLLRYENNIFISPEIRAKVKSQKEFWVVGTQISDMDLKTLLKAEDNKNTMPILKLDETLSEYSMLYSNKKFVFQICSIQNFSTCDILLASNRHRASR